MLLAKILIFVTIFNMINGKEITKVEIYNKEYFSTKGYFDGLNLIEDHRDYIFKTNAWGNEALVILEKEEVNIDNNILFIPIDVKSNKYDFSDVGFKWINDSTLFKRDEQIPILSVNLPKKGNHIIVISSNKKCLSFYYSKANDQDSLVANVYW